MTFELPEDPRTARRASITRWVSFLLVVLLIALLGYLGYVGFEGSRQLVHPIAPSANCSTPASAFGWTYEAINYDQGSDAAVDGYPDPGACPRQGAAAGSALVTPDGARIAGWYVPAASGVGPQAATVVVLHGHGSNKSDMLSRAAVLHDDYNLVLIDFRNHGQSTGEHTTLGVLEQADLKAVVEWVLTEKQPRRLAILASSMGGAVASVYAVRTPEVDAVILESTHATLANAIEGRLARQGYPLALPGAWSILLGGLIRTGQDMSAVDPVQSIERYGSRPLLVISAGRDDELGASDAQDIVSAARVGGADAELEVCPEAGHGTSYETCPTEYRDWVLGFLRRALPAT